MSTPQFRATHTSTGYQAWSYDGDLFLYFKPGPDGQLEKQPAICQASEVSDVTNSNSIPTSHLKANTPATGASSSSEHRVEIKSSDRRLLNTMNPASVGEAANEDVQGKPRREPKRTLRWDLPPPCSDGKLLFRDDIELPPEYVEMKKRWDKHGSAQREDR